METLLISFGKFRWYVRYSVAAMMLWAGWHMFTVELFYMLPAIFVFCAAMITKEASPSLFLLAGSIWIWPENFLSTPFAQITFGIILSALAAMLMFVMAPVVAVALYTRSGYVKYASDLT